MVSLKLFISLLTTCFFMDMLWLGFIAKKLYDDSIGTILRKSGTELSPVWPSAFLVYIAIVGGIIVFVLPKSHGDWIMALIWGGLFGMVTYGIYDFTNHAVLANWPLKLTIIDFCWGTFLCASVSCIGSLLQNYFLAK